MLSHSSIHYASDRLLRSGWRRRDADWLRQQLAQPATRIIALKGDRIACAGEPLALPIYLPASEVSQAAATAPVFLGLVEGRACFAIMLGDSLAHNRALESLLAPRTGPTGSFKWLGVRQLVGVVDGIDSAILAFASALSVWRASCAYCAACGHPTVAIDAGHSHRCSNPACARQWFPRLDPAIITLVLEGQRCLLARQHGWPPRRYSTIAGFVEPGETPEHTVMRETFEEVGLRVSRIEYRGSQPWPFPSSLMLAFRAYALGTAIRTDGDEIEHADWYSAERIASDTATGALILPPADSISYRLIDDWIKGL